MSGYGRIAASASADACMTPKRASIDASEPSTPPSRGRYSLRSSPAAEPEVEAPAVRAAAAAATTLRRNAHTREEDKKAPRSSSESGGSESFDGTEGRRSSGDSYSDSSEDERDAAPIADVEAKRRGAPVAPQEVRPFPAARHTRVFDSWGVKGGGEVSETKPVPSSFPLVI